MARRLLMAMSCLCVLLMTGCSGKTFSKMVADGNDIFHRNDLYPILTEGGQSVVFNMTLSYKDMSMDGFLMATMEDDESVHAVCTAFMGMTLFDFTIHEHGFDVNNCMEQLNRKMILRILKKDLVTLFTRNVNSTFKAKKYKEPAKTKLGYKIRTFTGMAHYLIDSKKKSVTHISLSGGPIAAEFDYTDECIKISHPRLGLEMLLFRQGE